MSESYNAGLKDTYEYGKKALKRRLFSGALLRKPQELALHLAAANVKYEPLLGPNYIRLLKLERGPAGSIIRCSLRRVDLGQEPSYTALSYTWKRDPSLWRAAYTFMKSVFKEAWSELYNEIPDSLNLRIPSLEAQVEEEQFKTIICNGWPTQIQSNLHAALLQLRKRRHGEFWVDALCINQDDSVEKASQVLLMGRIYQCAETVLVWLGTCLTGAVDGAPYLERLAASNNPLPPMVSMRDFHKTQKWTMPPGSDVDAETVAKASYTAFSVVMSSWFKRVWVVQEICWARHVVYALDDMELSGRAMLRAFELAQETWRFYKKRDDKQRYKEKQEDGGKDGEDQDYNYSFPKAPEILQARERFQKGELWTLHEWLLACRGRKATVSLDFIFAGLSLIQPNHLVLDQTLLSSRSTTITPLPESLFARREHYPQTVLPQGLRRLARLSYQSSHDQDKSSPNLLPHGLWQALKPDYTISSGEAFVNLAACLLSHAEVATLLSLAARTSRTGTWRAGWHHETSEEHLETYLPSWIPNFRNPVYHAGDISLKDEVVSQQSVSTRGQSGRTCSISNNGTTLIIEALQFDVIDGFILESDAIDLLETPQLQVLLSFLLASPADKRPDLVETLALTILCGKTGGGLENHGSAVHWLCGNLAAAVARQVYHFRVKQFFLKPDLSDSPQLDCEDFQYWHNRQDRESRNAIEKLICDFDEAIGGGHSIHGWTSPLTAKKWDQFVHHEFIVSLDPTNPFSPAAPAQDTETGSLKPASRLERFIEWAETLEGNRLDSTPRGRLLLALEHETNVTFLGSIAKDPELHKLAQAFEDAACSALAWRKVFVTSNGYIGLGPEWLEKGDVAMLVPGSRAVYIFTSVKKELQSQERSLRAALDKNEMDYHDEWKNYMTSSDSEQKESGGDDSSAAERPAEEESDEEEHIREEDVKEGHVEEEPVEGEPVEGEPGEEEHAEEEHQLAENQPRPGITKDPSWRQTIHAYAGRQLSKTNDMIAEHIDKASEYSGKQIDRGFESMGRAIDRGFDAAERRIDAMGTALDRGFEATERRIEAMGRVTLRIIGVNTRLERANATRLVLQRSLERVLSCSTPLDAWILKGEAHVEKLTLEAVEMHMRGAHKEHIMIV